LNSFKEGHCQIQTGPVGSKQANTAQKVRNNDPICFSPYLYRVRNQVERFFNKIKHCRRAATRYDRLAANYHQTARIDQAMAAC